MVSSLAWRKTFNESRRSERSPPVGPYEISRMVEMHVERPAVGALEGLTDASRQMDIGGRDDQSDIGALDLGDAIERMLRLFCGLFVTRQVEDLVLVPPGEIAVQCQDARRQPVLDTAAGGTNVLFRRREIVGPLPAAVMIDGAALAATCRLFELLPRLVRIKHAVLPSASGDTAKALIAGWSVSSQFL